MYNELLDRNISGTLSSMWRVLWYCAKWQSLSSHVEFGAKRFYVNFYQTKKFCRLHICRNRMCLILFSFYTQIINSKKCLKNNKTKPNLKTRLLQVTKHPLWEQKGIPNPPWLKFNNNHYTFCRVNPSTRR